MNSPSYSNYPISKWVILTTRRVKSVHAVTFGITNLFQEFPIDYFFLSFRWTWSDRFNLATQNLAMQGWARVRWSRQNQIQVRSEDLLLMKISTQCWNPVKPSSLLLFIKQIEGVKRNSANCPPLQSTICSFSRETGVWMGDEAQAITLTLGWHGGDLGSQMFF